MLAVALFLLLLSAAGTPAQPARNADPFDYYSHRIPWKEEISRLDNFAIFLLRNPETVGFLAYYSGPDSSRRRAKARAEKSVRYLTRLRRVDPRRIITIYGGEMDHAATILQPAPEHSPPPDLQVFRKKDM